MRYKLFVSIALGAFSVAAPSHADPLTPLAVPIVASGLSPFAPECGGPGEAIPSSFNYLNSEVETHIAVNPTDSTNIVAFWQQDRWNDGGSHGNVAAYSTDGGAT